METTTGRTVDDGTELELAEGRLVDDVDRDACGDGGTVEGLRLCFRFGIGEGDCGTVENVDGPRTGVVRQCAGSRAALDQGCHFAFEFGCVDFYVGTRGG